MDKLKVKKLIEETLYILNRKSIHLFSLDISDLNIKTDLKGKAAGKYYPSKKLINLNYHLLSSHTDEMLNRILPHEIAHHICYTLYGDKAKPHGKEWKDICIKLGYTPETYHRLPTSKCKELKKYPYRCGCSNHLITSIRHNRIQKGVAYFCKRCNKKLVPLKE